MKELLIELLAKNHDCSHECICWEIIKELGLTKEVALRRRQLSSKRKSPTDL